MKTLQEMTRSILDASGYSEARLATIVGTTQPTINRIRKGVTKNPAYEVGKKIEGIYLSLETPPPSCSNQSTPTTHPNN